MNAKRSLQIAVVVLLVIVSVGTIWYLWEFVWPFCAIFGALALYYWTTIFWRWLWREPDEKARSRDAAARASGQLLYEKFLAGDSLDLPSINCSNWMHLRSGEQCYLTASATVEISLLHEFERSLEDSVELKVHGFGVKQSEKAIDKFSQLQPHGEIPGTILALNVGVVFVASGKVNLIPASVIARSVRDRWVITLVLNDGNGNIPFKINDDPNVPYLIQAAIDRISRDAQSLVK